MSGTKGSGVRRATTTKAEKSVSTKQPFTPTAHSAEAQSGTSGVEMKPDTAEERAAINEQWEGIREMEQAQDQDQFYPEPRPTDRKPERAAFLDTQVSAWLQQAEQDLYQQNIEKVRGELHWRIRHFQTKRYIYDVYPEWRIEKPVSFWEATLCSCPTGYIRGAPCEHKAMLRFWIARHRGAEGVKHLLDLPI